MLRFTFEDGSRLTVSTSAPVITNKGPMQADQVATGHYVRCGTSMFCRVDDIVAL